MFKCHPSDDPGGLGGFALSQKKVLHCTQDIPPHPSIADRAEHLLGISARSVETLHPPGRKIALLNGLAQQDADIPMSGVSLQDRDKLIEACGRAFHELKEVALRCYQKSGDRASGIIAGGDLDDVEQLCGGHSIRCATGVYDLFHLTAIHATNTKFNLLPFGYPGGKSFRAHHGKMSRAITTSGLFPGLIGLPAQDGERPATSIGTEVQVVSRRYSVP